MTYHRRHDLPYHYALADAFTVCDNYHASVLGSTDPNRYYTWTGWVGNDGVGGGPVVSNAEAGYDWRTYPERLEGAGISWKVYQDIGVVLEAAGRWGWTPDPFIGNFGDTSLLYFRQYQSASAGNPLTDKAKTGTNINALNRDPVRLMDILREDVRRGALPQVSWIVAPEAYSEYPPWPPDFGAWYVSQVVDILSSDAAIWSKTVLFVVFDEEGGFFDHLVPPTPPQSRAEGLSTVETSNESFAGDGGAFVAGPYGLGPRVPMIVVSPWSRGGWVNSQLFDHTSLIRFLEARFARRHPELIETNITPWRRAVAGDLTTTLDFKTPNARSPIALPSTDAFKPIELEPQPEIQVVAPAHQRLPRQETGVRPARGIPYQLDAESRVRLVDGSIRIRFRNTGSAAVVFQVRSGTNAHAPRTYTVDPSKQLTDAWTVDATVSSIYDLSVYGPNGFYRGFKGRLGHHQADLIVRAVYDDERLEIALFITNRGSETAKVRFFDRYTSRQTRLVLGCDQFAWKRWSLQRTGGWYDLTITVDDDPDWAYQ